MEILLLSPFKKDLLSITNESSYIYCKNLKRAIRLLQSFCSFLPIFSIWKRLTFYPPPPFTKRKFAPRRSSPWRTCSSNSPDCHVSPCHEYNLKLNQGVDNDGKSIWSADLVEEWDPRYEDAHKYRDDGDITGQYSMQIQVMEPKK